MTRSTEVIDQAFADTPNLPVLTNGFDTSVEPKLTANITQTPLVVSSIIQEKFDVKKEKSKEKKYSINFEKLMLGIPFAIAFGYMGAKFLSIWISPILMAIGFYYFYKYQPEKKN